VNQWIVAQIGAREHYAIARALHREGLLECLVTDTWIAPGNLLGRAKPALRQRYHSDLAAARVCSRNVGSIAFELRAKVAGRNGWALIMQRNEWFQRAAVKRLRDYGSQTSGPLTLFAYSYAAQEILRHAKERGWRTVLGQIDPGLHEEKLVQKLYKESAGELGDSRPAPPEYWQNWRTECDLADLIVVNSEWSREGLLAEGISSQKLRVVPLAYETAGEKDHEATELPGHKTNGFVRHYPERFTPERPMRVLFLGQINLRKGARPLLDAVRLLADEPIEFWFVGPVQIRMPEVLREHPRVRWFGAVSRRDTARFYRDADVFIFPTFSDGYGLTQLEAQFWRLPIIRSRYCGQVVSDGMNGIVLPHVTSTTITDALRLCCRQPYTLQSMSAHSADLSAFSLDILANRLSDLAQAVA